MSLRAVRPIVVLLSVLLVAGAAAARAAEEAEKPSKGPEEFKGLKFRLVGPAVGGRVSRVAGVPGNPLVDYAATASGGVWKSEDGGIHWKPIFDDQPDASIGSIAVAPSNPAVVYVGAGEANIRGNVAPGHGIYKSTDGGKTWMHVWTQEGQIGQMIVHPTDPDIAFAAVLGHAFGPNPQRGVYRTKDGGKSWQQVLKKDPDTGASSVCFDPSNPNVLFAGLWQARRRPWVMTSGGPGSGLYMSRDGGDSWTQLTKKGLPEGIWGKVGVAVAPSDGRRVYALIEAEKGGLYRSDNGGDTWERISEHHALTQRPWYYMTLTIDPTNPDVVWFPQVPMLRSIDGGRTIKQVKGAHHGDHHDVWIDPQNPKRVIGANDGGVDLSWNGGETWYAPPLPIAQFYHVTADNSIPYRVSGAMQDLGTASGPSNSLASGGITTGDWHDVGGGEAGHTASDPSNPDVVYAGEYFGIITRYDQRTGMTRNVSIYPENWSGHGAEDNRYRFQWTAPILISPHDPKVVYHAGNVLFRSADGGQTWTAISPDLTRNDKSKQKWSGGPLTGDNTGVEWYCTIFAVAESPKEKGLIWVGTDDGLVQVTRDGGAHWTNVTANIKGIPEWGTVSLIEPSPFDAATAYVVVDAHRLDDMRPYLWKTSDYGKSWKSLTSTLPQDVHLHAVREDPKRRGLLYAGTERGVELSRDDGASWQVLGLNLPTVAVHDLVVKDNDLVVGTHGRSIFILDDLTPVRDWSREIADRPAHLFPPQPAIRWESRESFHDEGPGENPPDGAILQYSLKKKPEGEIRMEILDQAGAVVRTFTSTKEAAEVEEDDPDAPEAKEKPVLSLEPGVQRIAWDLAYDRARTIKGAKREGNPEAAPRVIPGTYTVRLTIEGKSLTAPLEVRPDPRLAVPPGDLEAQVRFALEVRERVSRLTALVAQIRAVRRQIDVKVEALEDDPRAADWMKSARSLITRCDALEEKLHNPKAEVEYDILAKGARLYSRLSPLLVFATGGSGAPTQGMREVFADQSRELDGYEAEWKGIVGGDLVALGQKARALKVEEVVVPDAAAAR
ncbi:MAG TPA: glycosyl hydrolase [Candidatus Polarisedimenticolia bacterium]|nr:glycosyl hydrolase [Candidatus Polarisedimenticolia bacterium]